MSNFNYGDEVMVGDRVGYIAGFAFDISEHPPRKIKGYLFQPYAPEEAYVVSKSEVESALKFRVGDKVFWGNEETIYYIVQIDFDPDNDFNHLISENQNSLAGYWVRMQDLKKAVL
jgi:hypothetical protein